MSRFLGIVGSPRHGGNTHVLVNQILNGAAKAGAKVDSLFLADHTIRECDGCHRCWKGDHCPKAEDMAEIYPRIIAANVLVFGTPVYWYGPTGLMKLFIDRFVFFNSPGHRPWIAGKSAVIAVPYEDTDPETVRPVVEFFEKCFDYLQVNLAARLLVPGVTGRGEVNEKPEVLEEAFNIGHSLAGQIAKPDQPLGLLAAVFIQRAAGFIQRAAGFMPAVLIEEAQFARGNTGGINPPARWAWFGP